MSYKCDFNLKDYKYNRLDQIKEKDEKTNLKNKQNFQDDNNKYAG